MSADPNSGAGGGGAPAGYHAAVADEPPAEAGAPSAARALADATGEEVQFSFAHRLFSVPGVWFGRTADLRDAALHIPMGDYTATVTLDTLRTAFRIARGGPDDRMLDLVAGSLDHVKRITPGEKLPREVLDGSASWTVEDRHAHLARGRLALRLARTTEMPLDKDATREARLAEFGASEDARAAILHGVDRLIITERVRLSEHEAEEVVAALVHETSYIEALREDMAFLDGFPERLGGYRRLFPNDQSFADGLIMMQALARKPRDEVRETLAGVDRMMEHVPEVLQRWTAAAEHVRAARNRLHRISVDWAELRQRWDRESLMESKLAGLLRETYRFLALRYAKGQAWPRFL
jgi:hypothetical protein